MPEFDDFPSEPQYSVFCVFGAGDVLQKANMVARARVEKALESVFVYAYRPQLYAFFGHHAPSMKYTELTEAETMEEYFLSLASDIKTNTGKLSESLAESIRIHDTPDINSVSTTCAAIVREYLSKRQKVYLVINWPYIPRTRYLLRKQAERQGLKWKDVKHLVHNYPCGGTFIPYVKGRGLIRATKRWLWEVLRREGGAWGKALLDPYSEKYNQDRKY